MAELRKYRVELVKALWALIDVKVDVEDLTEDEIIEYAVQRALAKSPRICAQCGGWGEKDVSVSDDDEYVDIREWYGKDYDVKKHGTGVKLIE